MTETGTLKRVMKAFDWQLQKKGYIPMSGQIVDASLVPAPKQRNTDREREAIKAGKSAEEIWPDEPNKAAQKDTDARWTLKIGGKVRYREDGTPLPMIALPVFGYKSHIGIDRRYGFIRSMAVTSASTADGRLLRRVISTDNTGSEVWADSAYRSQSNEKWLGDRMLTSRIHRKKPMANRCRGRRHGPMRRSPRSALMSSMCLPIRRTGSACSSAPSALPAPRRNWPLPTWPTTSTA